MLAKWPALPRKDGLYLPGRAVDKAVMRHTFERMKRGWDGQAGAAPGFPKKGWKMRAEGLAASL